jgi:hypothetical protein
VKTEGAIRHKLKQVRFRYLKQCIEAALERRPENCAHNGATEGMVASDTVRVCFAQIDVPGRKVVLCDERFGGCARAEACPSFTPRHVKADLKEGFYAELEGLSFPEIAYNYPDMAALLWVIADEGLEVPTPDPHEFDLHETVGTGIIAMDGSEHAVTASPDTGTTAATTPSDEPHATPDLGHLFASAAASGAFGYREPEPELPAKSPSWIDRILGRVSP